MSIEGIRSFMEALEDDEQMQDELADAIGEKDGADAAAAASAYAATKGYEFSTEEAVRARAIMVTEDAEDGELDEAELEAVAGGGWGKDANRFLRRSYRRVRRGVRRGRRRVTGTIHRGTRHVARNTRDFFRGW